MAGIIKQLQQASGTPYNIKATALRHETVGGTFEAMTVTDSDITELYDGLTFVGTLSVTGSPSSSHATLNVSSKGAKYLRVGNKDNTLQLINGGTYLFVYNKNGDSGNGEFHIIHPAVYSGSGDSVQYLATHNSLQALINTFDVGAQQLVNTFSVGAGITVQSIQQSNGKISKVNNSSVTIPVADGGTVISTNNRLVTTDWLNTSIQSKFDYTISNSAGTTPNVTNLDGTQGTLSPSATTMYKIYLVHHPHTESSDVYDEWITIDKGASASPRYQWEKLGHTDVDFSDIVDHIADHVFTPTASLASNPSFSGTSSTSGASSNSNLSITVQGASSGTQNTYTPTGTLSISMKSHNHTIEAQNVNVSASATSTNNISSSETQTSGSISYLEDATVNGAALSNTSIKTINSNGSVTAGTQSSLTVASGSETLVFTPNTLATVTLPTYSTKSIVTGVQTQPSITATTKYLSLTNGTVSVTAKNSESVTVNSATSEVNSNTFTGDGKTISATNTHTHSVTPSGTISKPNVTVNDVTLPHNPKSN